MNAKTKWKISIASAALVLAVLLPEVVSGGWHLIHGRSVAFRGWNVTLPFEWFAMKHGDGMTVLRMSRNLWRPGPVVEFQPVHFGPNYSFNYGVYETEQNRMFQGRGYQLAQQQSVRIAGEDGQCWTFVSKTRQADFWIACIVPGEMTSADYMGSRSDANAFGEILSNIRRVEHTR